MVFLVIAGVLAICDWAAIWKHWESLSRFSKPGVILALMAGVWQEGEVAGLIPGAGVHSLEWVLLGLLLSLLGDLLLMRRREALVAGGAMFLLAYACYAIALLNGGIPRSIVLPAVIVIGMVAAIGGRVVTRLWGGLVANGRENLKIPMAIYWVSVSALLFGGLSRLFFFGWLFFPAYLAAAGSLSLYVSDLWLTRDRFVSPAPGGRLRVRIAYHLGQFGVVLGVLLYFLKPAG